MLGGLLDIDASVGIGACPTASAFLARTSGLDATHIAAYNALICGLVSDGIWTKLDVLHIYATQDTTTAQLNLISASYPGTLHGSPTFTADRGYAGVAASTTVYIDTSFTPSTAPSPKLTQNSAHISAWAVNNQGNGDWAIAGANLTSEITILPKWSDGNAYFRVNGNGTAGVTNADGSGYFLGSRTNSTTIAGYRNGSNILSSSSDNSASPASCPIISLATNISGAPTFGYGGQVAMLSFGSSMDATDATNFYNRLRTYMTAVGVP